jgi:transglutaminase-like putative cysteine protease
MSTRVTITMVSAVAMLTLTLTLVTLSVWPGDAAGQSTDAAPTAERTFDLVYEADVRNIPSGSGRVDVWVPLPPDDAHQDILDLRVDTPHAWTVNTDPEYGNSVLHLELTDVDVSSVPLTLHVRVRRREHRQPPVPVANPEPFDGRWLMPDRLVPLDDFVQTLAKEVTKEADTPAAKARAIYDYVVDTMTYDKTGTGWGNGDIYWACDARTGNCTDFHALFIGLNRAVGIPATFEIGFPLPADRASGSIEGYHCWAQFYLEGVGWVPVDTSEAYKHSDQREFFFGAHDRHRVLFSKGRDITLQPPQQGPPLNYFIYPYVEVDGVPFEDVDLRFNFQDIRH